MFELIRQPAQSLSTAVTVAYVLWVFARSSPHVSAAWWLPSSRTVGRLLFAGAALLAFVAFVAAMSTRWVAAIPFLLFAVQFAGFALRERVRALRAAKMDAAEQILARWAHPSGRSRPRSD